MKKLLLTLAIVGCLGTFSSVEAVAQTTNKKELTKEQKKEAKEKKKAAEEQKFANSNLKQIATLNFSFIPNEIDPEFGMDRILTCTDCYFNVDQNYLSVRLPYLGRFYITPVMVQEIPINITSSDFLYSVSTTDNITYKVVIVPQDLVSILNQGLKFVFVMNKDTGNATLTVQADNRQDVTYQGTF